MRRGRHLPAARVMMLAPARSGVDTAPDAVSMQVVDSVTGNFLDAATYTKPDGWQPDMARQNATIAGYANGSYVPVPFEKGGAPSYSALLSMQSCAGVCWHTLPLNRVSNSLAHGNRLQRTTKIASVGGSAAS